MSEYRVYTIGADGHIFKAEAMICQNDEEAIALVRTLAAEHTIEIWSGDRLGSILHGHDIRRRCRRERCAARLQNLPGRIEDEDNTNGLAFEIQIAEHNPLGGRRDLFEFKSIGRERLEPGPPVRFQRSPACIGVSAVALTFQAGIGRIQVEQWAKVVPPAGIEPIDDNSYLIDILVGILG